MKISTYWNAYKITLSRYLIASLENDCDGMAKLIKRLERIDGRLTAVIRRLDDYERQGEIDGGSDV